MNGLAGYFILGIFLISIFGCADDRPVQGPYPETGLASWYDPNATSTKLFKKSDVTCAMRKLDYGKYYRVCNLANNKCVFVRHNDFGPSMQMYKKGRIIDLSKTAFKRIADLNQGIIAVSVDQMHEADVD